MSSINSKHIKTASRYAKALSAFDERDLILSELHQVKSIFEASPDLKSFFSNPIVAVSDKKDVINRVFTDLSANVLNLFYVLIDKNRFEFFDTILAEFEKNLDEINNVIKIEIVSAVELTTDEEKQISEKLQKKLGSKIEPKYTIDEKIIAGLVIKIGDKVIDNSLKARFDGLEKQLI